MTKSSPFREPLGFEKLDMLLSTREVSGKEEDALLSQRRTRLKFPVKLLSPVGLPTNFEFQLHLLDRSAASQERRGRVASHE